MRCAIFGCNNDNQVKAFQKDIRFFRFPKDNVTRQLWVIPCCRSDSFNELNARICSKHFTADDYERNLKFELLNYLPKQGLKLKAGAVPSLFLPKGKSFNTKNTPRQQRALKRQSAKLVKEIFVDIK